MPDDLAKRAAVERAIAETERRIAQLESELQSAIESLAVRKAELEGIREADDAASLPPRDAEVTSRSTAEKVMLFRSLFRGREDVFPRLWTNSRTGKHGYAPACTNEWVREVCEKPRVKCGECRHQAFAPVDDRIVLDHLRGAHVIGAYPLLADETCWFLAIDLDGESWQEDVTALRSTCRELGLHPAVERSRSGRGAHVWFFFNAPVSASTARRMGSHVVTETMSRRHQLSMRSYDRMFPNQDTMPRGGFGNLIAVPFQDAARRSGNTLFLDGEFVPYPDQWGYLAALPRLVPQVVERIASDAQNKGAVVGVRSAGSTQEDGGLPPWDRLPSRFPPRPRITDPLPKTVRTVLAQRLFVEKAGLPSSLLNQVKRLAAFQNPEFFKRQNLRLSTALTPRVISCAEELDEHVALPRGCLSDLDALLKEYGVALATEDKRVDGETLDVTFRGTLTAGQKEAARALLAHENGVLVAPPGSGKTVVGVFLVARRRRSTLILIHRRPLLEQWVAQLAIFLNLSPKEIGRIGAGKNRPTGQIDVAMLQSLVHGEQVDDVVAGYGHVIVDECHHVPAVSFERVMREVKARFVVGLTATPQRRDGHDPILEMQLGRVRHSADSRGRGAASLTRRLFLRETSFKLPPTTVSPAIQDVYRFLAEDSPRNALIVDDVISAVENGRSPIVLTERRDHLELLAQELRKAVRNLIVLQGGMSEKLRREVTEQIERIPRDQERVILATGRFAGEGFDDPRLDTLFLALPVSWKGTLIQYAGRLHRHLPEKTDVRIYDYVDAEVPLLQGMLRKRLRGYRAMGYNVDDQGQVDAEP